MAITKHFSAERGFSLFELLAVVSILGVLAALAFPIISDVRDNAKAAKMASDLGVLNSATKAYLASSGDLSSAKSASEVLQKLKSQASSASSAVLNGYRGSFIDRRIEFVMQTAAEGNSTDRRLVWDSGNLRFSLKRSGDPGIKEVRLNEDLAESPVVYEDRKGVMDLAKVDDWIWDFTEGTPEAKKGITPVSYTPPVNTIPVAPPAPAAVPPTPASPLSPPLFSIPTDVYAIEDYPMSLTLLNPNPLGSSDVFYQVDFGGWKVYSGETLILDPYTRVDAQAIPRDPTVYTASSVAQESYDVTPIVLDPPLIIPDVESFGFFTNDPITITLADTNLPGRALIEFSLNNGPWMKYTDPFLLAPELFPSGATVEARSVSAGSPYYLPSSASLKYLPVGSLDLVGSTVGEFNSPTGGVDLVTNLSPGDSSSYFEWGNGSGAGLSESWLEFTGATFGDIVDGQQFSIGSLEYYNGSIRGGTGADTVNFELALTLDINGETYNPFFDFEFELINQVNTADPIESADFVYLDDARSSRTLVFNDYEFEFKIEFGNSSSDGFTFVDQFFVLEDESASAELFGTFTLLGPAPENQNDSTQGGVIIADDAGTGTFSDPLYQKLGYQDPEQFSNALLSDAIKARDDAKAARDSGTVFYKNFKYDYNDFISKHDSRDYYEAEGFLEKARNEERLIQQEANAADVAASIAEDLADRARGNAVIDPNAEDEAIEIAALAAEARDYADAARTLADTAATALQSMESTWAQTLATAPTSTSQGVVGDYVRYLKDKAKEEEGLAKSLRDSANFDSGATLSRAGDLTAKIADGKFFEAENLFNEILQLSANANKSALVAADASTRARFYAFEATEIANRENEDAINNLAAQANTIAMTTTAYADEARLAADQALVAASQADSEWQTVLNTGAANYPVDFAKYLHDKAKLARDNAKSARDEAKSQRDRAESKSGDTEKKVEEGKLSEAQTKFSETETAATTAENEALAAASEAFNARTFSVQAEMIATTTPSAKSIATNATTYASEAEAFAAEARVFADEALAFQQDAKAALP